MTKTHGKSGIIKIDESTAIGELQDWALDKKAALANGYSMGEDWEASAPGVKSWSGSAKVYFDAADAGQILLEVGARIKLTFYPSGDGTGEKYEEGYAVVSSISASGQKGDYLASDISFMGDGALTAAAVA